jgi:hypothetical protein
MLGALFDSLWACDQTHVAPAFPTPALREIHVQEIQEQTGTFPISRKSM